MHHFYICHARITLNYSFQILTHPTKTKGNICFSYSELINNLVILLNLG